MSRVLIFKVKTQKIILAKLCGIEKASFTRDTQQKYNMSRFTKIKILTGRWWCFFRKGLNNLEDWTLDNLLSAVEDVYRFLNAFYGAQPLTYWLILVAGPALMAWGIALSSQGDKIIAPALISLGASVTAIYWANALQKLTTSIPRAEWTCKISACNDNLVVYLLKLNGLNVKVHSRKIYSRELKATGMQETHATQENIRKLEILLLKRDIDFIIQLTHNQLKQIKQYLLDISRGVDKISQNYGRPMANREFNRDFADLQSALEEIIHTLGLAEEGKTPPTSISKKRIGVFSRNKSYTKNSIKRHTKIYIRSAHKKLIEVKPEVFWHTVMLIQYLGTLTTFTNTYGYNNHAALSVIKSRFWRMIERYR